MGGFAYLITIQYNYSIRVIARLYFNVQYIKSSNAMKEHDRVKYVGYGLIKHVNDMYLQVYSTTSLKVNILLRPLFSVRIC
jgi:hypothetical protein